MFESLEKEEARARAQMPIAELLYRIREWDKSWDDYFAKGVRPPNVTDFLEQLSKEFEVKKRVEYVRNEGDSQAITAN